MRSRLTHSPFAALSARLGLASEAAEPVATPDPGPAPEPATEPLDELAEAAPAVDSPAPPPPPAAPYGWLVGTVAGWVSTRRPATRAEWQRPAEGWVDASMCRGRNPPPATRYRVENRPEVDPALQPDPPVEVGTLAGPYGLVIESRPGYGRRVEAATRVDWKLWRHRLASDALEGAQSVAEVTIIGAPAEDPEPHVAEREAAHLRSAELRDEARGARWQ